LDVAGSLNNDTEWATQPVVTIQDADNNTVDVNSTVTLNASGATSVALGGTTSMDAVNGVANFAGKGLKLTGTAGSKTLTASISAPGSFSVPATISLGYGQATKLALTTEPTGFINRTNFTTQPVVTVQDVSGNTVGNSNISIDVSIDSGALTGTTRINAVNGVATFVGLGKTGTIGDKLLTFADSDGALTPIDKAFTLTHGAADHLVLKVMPTLVNDTVFSHQPSVVILDQDNNLVDTGSQSTQTVLLSASGATIGGTISVNAVGGIARFTDSGIKLTGTVGSKTVTATISAPSTISASDTVNLTYGAADHVSLSTQAANAENGSAFGTQPVAEIRDISENLSLIHI
jgi:hypothetical protein